MLGDHGHRFDPIRRTIVGRLEERLPFFSLHVPQEILTKKPELSKIIRENTKVMEQNTGERVLIRNLGGSEFRELELVKCLKDSTFHERMKIREAVI